ncbi:tyrosine-type recombinase/integrase [Erwinia persicina]|uniref:tyrosine-type recombinase/integrase n=1 Tax=Erwinia persicina TaxID=55211 RepID=UPI0007872804|nr:tyrosine-type recombinase/integrase [Erwinia persicina]
MLMPSAGTNGLALQSWETALALRGMALLQQDLPKYLLAPEVAVLLNCFDDERQRMLFAFLWNTGARVTEALMVTPEDLQLDGLRPFVRLRTLKQRNRGRGRPAKDEKVARVVPLLDAAFVREMRRYLATFRTGRRTPLFAVTRKTAWSWLQQATDRGEASGIIFAVSPVSPRTLRHSYAMHLFLNHVPPKVVHTYMGHERYESTEQYLKIFALDVAPQLGIRFSLDAQDFEQLLTRK